jgi:hypothetical protein
VSAFFAVALIISLWAVMERTKPFWRGFSYLGIGYIVVTITPALYTIGGVLPTSMILIMLMTESVDSESDAVEFVRAVQDYHQRFLGDEHFFVYALLHIASGLFIGLCAGILCQWRARRNEMREVLKDERLVLNEESASVTTP